MNDIVELAVADTDNPLLVLVAIPPILDATFRKELIAGAAVKTVAAVLVLAVKNDPALSPALLNTPIDVEPLKADTALNPAELNTPIEVEPVNAENPVMYVDVPLA